MCVWVYVCAVVLCCVNVFGYMCVVVVCECMYGYMCVAVWCCVNVCGYMCVQLCCVNVCGYMCVQVCCVNVCAGIYVCAVVLGGVNVVVVTFVWCSALCGCACEYLSLCVQMLVCWCARAGIGMFVWGDFGMGVCVCPC